MRRLRQDLLLAYKIVFNLASGAASNMFTLTNTLYSTCTRGHPYKLYLHSSRIDARKYFFSERITIPWNSLPATSADFSSILSFKRLINSVDLSAHVSLGFQPAHSQNELFITDLCLTRCHVSIFNLWLPVKITDILNHDQCKLVCCDFYK